MMMNNTFALVVLAMCAAAAMAVTVDHVDRVMLDKEAPILWGNWREVDGNAPISADELSTVRRIVVALRRRNVDRLSEMFEAVADPASPTFRSFKSLDEMRALLAPEAASVRVVQEWLLAHGAKGADVTAHGDAIITELTLGSLQRLLGVKFRRFTDGEHVVLASLDRYTVPRHVSHTVELVSGVTGLPLLKTGGVSRQSPVEDTAAAAAPAGAVTPDAIRQAYGVPAGHFVTDPRATVGVAEFSGQGYLPSDLQTFMQQYGPAGSAQFDKVAHVLGSPPPIAGVEASLDIQVVMSVAANATSFFIYQDGLDFGAMMIEWTTTVTALPNPPTVASVSYGSQDRSHGPVPSKTVQQRAEQDFMALGLRGVTLMFASGDSGAACGLLELCQLHASWPAVSPSSVSVGATFDVDTASTFSGGGFALDFDRPSYQDSAVQAYLSNPPHALPRSGMYNAKGRGTPDLGTFGQNFPTVVNGGVSLVSGTSMASPVAAAILTLVNDGLLRAGKAPLGPANPFLYSVAGTKALTYIANGDNASGGLCDLCFSATGWYCSPTMWSPVTGLGHPNFPALLEAALAAGANTTTPVWMQ